MRPFSKVSPALWQSSRFMGVSEDARHLMVYLLTCPHHNSAGCYVLPEGYALTDLRWEIARYKKACHTLIAAELIQVDEDTSEILIDRWFLHNGPMNGDHKVCVDKEIATIRSSALREVASAALNQAWDAGASSRAAYRAKKSGSSVVSMPIRRST
jgi:hypothetical protein